MLTSTKSTQAWAWGDKTRLANLAGISPSYLSGILSGVKHCPIDRAKILEHAARRLGYDITALEWAFPAARKNNSLFD